MPAPTFECRKILGRTECRTASRVVINQTAEAQLPIRVKS